jgi:hypothetical protein
MARERRREERSVQEVIRHIEERVERRHAEMMGVPQKRIEETPEMRVDPKAQRLAEKLADALGKGVRALDRW